MDDQTAAEQQKRTEQQLRAHVRRQREQDPADQAERLEKHQRKAEEAMRRRQEQLAKLQASGPGITLPTCYQLHLLVHKLTKDQKEGQRHGVLFRRDGADLVLEATNGQAACSIRRRGDGLAFAAGEVRGDHRAIMPAKAAKMLAAAKAELAQLWFVNGRVSILVDDVLHEYWQIPRDELPFPTENLRAIQRSTRLGAVRVDARQLQAVQKALGTDQLQVLHAGKGLLALVPAGADIDDPDDLGFLAIPAEAD